MSTMNEEEIQGLEALLYLNKLSEVEVPINELLDGWRLLTDRRKRLVLMSAQVAHVLFSDKIPEDIQRRVRVVSDGLTRLRISSQPPLS